MKRVSQARSQRWRQTLEQLKNTISRQRGAFAVMAEWSGGAPSLDQRLPSYLPFRASWQMAAKSSRVSFTRSNHPV